MEKVYLYYMDKESKEIVSSFGGKLCECKVKNPKVGYISTFDDDTRRGYVYKVAPKPGEVIDFKGPNVKVWLHENNKAEAYKCFMAYFRIKFEEDMKKMWRLIEEAEEVKNGN